MAKTYREWNVEQAWLLPPSVLDFVPADHVAHFVRETVREQLDLSAILAPYEQEERGCTHAQGCRVGFIQMSDEMAAVFPEISMRAVNAEEFG